MLGKEAPTQAHSTAGSGIWGPQPLLCPQGKALEAPRSQHGVGLDPGATFVTQGLWPQNSCLLAPIGADVADVARGSGIAFNIAVILRDIVGDVAMTPSFHVSPRSRASSLRTRYEGCSISFFHDALALSRAAVAQDTL
jgi:hypothetical protein